APGCSGPQPRGALQELSRLRACIKYFERESRGILYSPCFLENKKWKLFGNCHFMKNQVIRAGSSFCAQSKQPRSGVFLDAYTENA
ncbi:hypothetical protein, partial [Pusillibacter faecalis]|uniref:hypothetical protein n=1 Tax=Pusillibacter faecalis TaxID=2714358 RepID=UPI00294294CD